MSALFDAPMGVWRNRRDDKDHITENRECADSRCAEFREVYELEFFEVHALALSTGAFIEADQVRRRVQQSRPDALPCHINGLGSMWSVWVNDGLLREVGTVRGAARGSNGSLHRIYKPLPVQPSLFGGDAA